ncbi:MAG: hypothetical protein R3279_09675, partial [Putridiphycobacter sp.]|nr:hypothetical protein [Putridiphycobacter sp.]
HIMAIALMIPFGIIIATIYFILVKTEKIVTFLKLLNGHSEDIVLTTTFDESTVFKLAIVIISLYLFISNLPVFLYQTFSFFQSSKHEYSGLLETFGVAIYFEFYTWVMALSNLMIAYLLFSNYHHVSLFLSKKIVEKSPEAIDDFTNE